MTEDQIFEALDFSLDITVLKNGTLLEIAPFLEIESDTAATLIASFHVDSMEMIESARFAVVPGFQRIPFRETVRIGNPNLWNVHTAGEPLLYEMSLVFYKDGNPYYRRTRITGFRFPAWDKLRNFSLNGLPVRWKMAPADVSDAELEDLCRRDHFNFIRLKDTADGLEERLMLCDRLGIVAALELSGEKRLSLLEIHPCVCLFIGEADSRGHRIYQESGTVVPFLFSSEFMTGAPVSERG